MTLLTTKSIVYWDNIVWVLYIFLFMLSIMSFSSTNWEFSSCQMKNFCGQGIFTEKCTWCRIRHLFQIELLGDSGHDLIQFLLCYKYKYMKISPLSGSTKPKLLYSHMRCLTLHTHRVLNMRAGSMLTEAIRPTWRISFAIILSFSKLTSPSTFESFPIIGKEENGGSGWTHLFCVSTSEDRESTLY